MNHSLRALLERHQPEDPVEAAYVARMLALLDASDPFSRDHFVPGHFTASSFVLAPERDALLLILHGKLHRWLQPGGHVEPADADIIAAARREVAEEVGLAEVTLASDGIFDVDIHTLPPMKGAPAHEHFDVRFLFVAPSRVFLAGSDARAARWVKFEDVSEVESDASVMRAVRKLL